MGSNDFINMVAFRGDDISLGLKLTDYVTKDPIDITGWIFSMTIKEKTYQPDTDAAVVVDVLVHADPSNGITGVLIPNTKTNDLIGVYQYDIQYKTLSGIIRTFMRGQIDFLDDVSRR